MTASHSPAAIIINPTAGPSRRRRDRGRLAEIARDTCSRLAVPADVVFTEQVGHGRALAAEFVQRGFSLIIAWGGDGTVNEVASALLFQEAALGIVPAGSGNGLATELGISRHPARAIATAIGGTTRTIDVGVVDGCPFVNLAGVGLDVAVADLFGRLTGRGLRSYVQATVARVLSYQAATYTITVGEKRCAQSALLVELANGRQYGNGAVIAPRAQLDDGLLDLVIVEPLSALRTLWGARRLFNGTIDRDPRVQIQTVPSATISADQAIRFHVDGEVRQGGTALAAMLHPGALRVRVARASRSRSA